MQCPFCGGDDDKVIDSRGSEGGQAVRRRRQCLVCGRRFTTYERVEETTRIIVVKKDGSRVPYDRQRLLSGLQKACYKRPVSDKQLMQIVEIIEESIFRNYEKDVPSSFIGDTASDCLRKTDKVAFIRFASVYREFEDVGELIEHAEKVRDIPDEDPDQKILFDKSDTDPDSAQPNDRKHKEQK